MRSSLFRIAEEIARNARDRAARLQIEVAQLEEQAAQKKTAIATANLSLDRLASFKIATEMEYPCPFCWIEEEVRSILRPVPSADEGDVFRCEARGHEVVFGGSLET